MKLLKQTDRLFRRERTDRLHHGRDVGKPSSLCFLLPFPRIAVSVEDNALVLRQILLDQVMHRHIEVLCRLKTVCRLTERLCHNRIQRGIRAADRILAAHAAEFKFITRKGER